MSDQVDSSAVPPGPGVRPPFAAAPTEGRSARIWLGLSLAGAVLAVCCGAGVVALGGLAVTSGAAVNEQVQRAVGDYLDALIESDWEQAYQLRCEEDQEAESLGEFTGRVRAQPRVESYELGDVDPLAEELELPAELSYADGTSERRTFPVAQDASSGRFEVCGLDR